MNFIINIISDTIKNKRINLKTEKEYLLIFFNILNITNIEISKNLNKIKSIIDGEKNDKSQYNIILDRVIPTDQVNKIICKLHDILYKFYPAPNKINLYNANTETKILFNELNYYKNIIMQPNKNNKIYLDYLLSRIPPNYKSIVFEVKSEPDSKDFDLFPLIRAVNSAGSKPGYFIHILPKKIDPEKFNIFLVGKGVIFDSGGINLKTKHIEEMKIDISGSSMVFSVLNLLASTGYDSKYNIHVCIPIVENLIDKDSYLPGSVLTSMSNKTIEVINTDAEGRLILVDSLDFINMFLLKELDPKKCLILDVATLTSNVSLISAGFSGIIMGNSLANNYLIKLMEISDNTGEYVDRLCLREEILEVLKSNTADLTNKATDENNANCIIAGTFLNYFVNKEYPWIHFDIGIIAYKGRMQTSYGLNLLFEFIKGLNK